MSKLIGWIKSSSMNNLETYWFEKWKKIVEAHEREGNIVIVFKTKLNTETFERIKKINAYITKLENEKA